MVTQRWVGHLGLFVDRCLFNGLFGTGANFQCGVGLGGNEGVNAIWFVPISGYLVTACGTIFFGFFCGVFRVDRVYAGRDYGVIYNVTYVNYGWFWGFMFRCIRLAFVGWCCCLGVGSEGVGGTYGLWVLILGC